ncbi:MAG: hypothetical protein LC650_02780 [Actinobacteria bacterium]|nr:hypothetical protein [Actinomycetota bacterium]
MATLDNLIVRLLYGVGSKLEFKEAALRYCNHSKKRDKLARQVTELRKLSAIYTKYLEEGDE